MNPSAPLLEVKDIKKHFSLARGLTSKGSRIVRAVDGVSFEIARGEVLSLVGESGCGKSTIGRLVLRLIEATDGQVTLLGNRIDNMPEAKFRPLRRHVQIVFQDPFSSLNPRMTVRDLLSEPAANYSIAASGRDMDAYIADLLEKVGLPRRALNSYPHEFSGGQRQRIAIARALAPKPDLIVFDEPVSALDVSVKAQIVNLLSDLRSDLGVAFLFISHDLAIVEHLTDRVAVMYLGKLVEIGNTASVFLSPRHPYTKALLSSIPIPDPALCSEMTVLQGELPSPINPPNGCRFHTRCPHAFARCWVEEPRLRKIHSNHSAACHLDEPGESVLLKPT